MPGKLIVLLSLIYATGSCTSANPSGAVKERDWANQIIVRNDFRNYFDSCAVEGSIAIYDVQHRTWIVSDTTGIYQETLPASTFKIVNTLIALETNTIKDENEIVQWPGSTDTVKYGYRPDIYRDLTVADAFRLSAGWVYVEISKKIGKEKYKEYLLKSGYGNDQLAHNDPDFWNFGSFAISPHNQVEFIHNLYREKLPFSKRNMDVMKQLMLTAPTDDYTIRAKTGWTREHNINTGWWTGYIETPKGAYIFATRLLQDRKMNRADFGSCRKEITLKVFRKLGIIV